MTVELLDGEDEAVTWLIDIDLDERAIPSAIENYRSGNPEYDIEGFIEWLTAHGIKASLYQEPEPAATFYF